MTPLRAARSSCSGNSSSPTIMDLKLSTSLCTSARFLPTSRSAIIEAEAWEMEQPRPVNFTSAELVPLEAGVDAHLIAAEGVEEVLLEIMVLQFAPVAGPPVMVHEDLRVELAHHAHLANAPRNRRARSSAVSRASTSSSVL